MTPAAAPIQPTQPDAADPVLRAALLQLLENSLTVARVSARLAEVEERAVEVLAAGAAEAARKAIAAPQSLADAIAAGQVAEASDAARDATIARMASITAMHDKAARAVRRTVALIQRLDERRPVREERRATPPTLPPHAARGTPPEGSALAVRRDCAERPDTPDLDDEIRGQTDEQAVGAICRDLRADPAPFLELVSPCSPAPQRAVQAHRPEAEPGAPASDRGAGAEPRAGPIAAPKPDT